MQVLATNAEGSSPWSPVPAKFDDKMRVSTKQRPPPNNALPAFVGTSPTREVAENSGAGDHGRRRRHRNRQPTPTDVLTYSISGAAEFTIAAASGQISVAQGAVLDFEAATTSYTVAVSVSDSKDTNGKPPTLTVDATISITISVTDVKEPPAAPGAPSVTQSSSDPETSLEVAWSAPDMTGKPALTEYDVQYRVQGSADWSSVEHDRHRHHHHARRPDPGH